MMMKISTILFLGMLFAGISNEVNAQHNHGRRNTVDLEFESIPPSDSILEAAPQDVVLRFNEYVRLVKFTLKAESIRSIDINFVFSNDYSRVFIQKLPNLIEAPYYIAEWAALNGEDVIVYGSFTFSFGPDAEKPSTIIESKEFASDPLQR